MSVNFRNEGFQQLIDISTDPGVAEKNAVFKDARSQLSSFDDKGILLNLTLIQATIDNIQKWGKYGFIFFAVLLLVVIGIVVGLLVKYDQLAEDSSKAPASTVSPSSKTPTATVTETSSAKAPSTKTLSLKPTTANQVASSPTVMQTSQATAHCPQGYTLYEAGNLCYKFYNNCLSWYDSRSVCEHDGGDLLVIDGTTSFAFFREKARQNQVPGGCGIHGMWIGLREEEGENTWTWINGKPLTSAIKFGPGEPNGGTYENCAHLFTRVNYLLNDASCSHNQISFLCGMTLKNM